MPIQRIVIPTRPQPDTVVAIFLLKMFGQQQYPGVELAAVEVHPTLPDSATFESLVAEGTLALDVGGGELDHHGKGVCTSHLVAEHLGIAQDPALGRLLAYADRDDKLGKGILSTDPIDRAFGLSGLIASMNKMHPQDPNAVVNAALPLLAAHYHSAREHHVELPAEVERKKSAGQYSEHAVRQGGKALKMVCVVSDKPSMPTYLRSQQGPRADVVVQKSEQTNHLCVLSRQERNIDLSMIAALIRMREAQLAGLELSNDHVYLGQTGRIAEVGHWYFDPATNSLLNGGAHNRETPESRIAWDEFTEIVKAGLELGGK